MRGKPKGELVLSETERMKADDILASLETILYTNF